MNYIILTSFKNEDRFIELTINSVINQKHLPLFWLLINDNSTDSSKKIIQKYLPGYNWIKLIDYQGTNVIEKGARIAHIINESYNAINIDHDLMCIVDGDVKFDDNFFSEIIKYFELNPKLGIASGRLIYQGKLEPMTFPELTRGATKVYRKECFKQIGGLYETTGWDTLDNESAMSLGWETQLLDIRFEHLKEEGKTQGMFRKYFNNGLYYGKIPYLWYYMILKLIYNIFNKPFFISSFLILLGYIKMRYIIKNRPFPDLMVKQIHINQKKRIKRIIGL